MSVPVRIFLAVLAVGAMLWLAFITAGPHPIPPSNPMVPLFCFVVGLWFALTVFAWAAKSNPNGLLAKGNNVPPLSRVIILVAGFVFGLAYMVVAG